MLELNMDLVLIPTRFLFMVEYHIYLVYRIIKYPNSIVIGFENGNRRVWVEQMMEVSGGHFGEDNTWERLQHLLEHSTKSLNATEVSNLVDASMGLLKDNNFRDSQGALQALSFAASFYGEKLKLHFNALLPTIVERLGDGKQPVHNAARRLLRALMEFVWWSQVAISTSL